MKRCKKKHEHDADILLYRLFGLDLLHGDRPRSYVTINFVSAFEDFGSYEDMGYGWELEFHGFNEGIKARGRCLECAIEKVTPKLCYTKWDGWWTPDGKRPTDSAG